MFSLLIFTSLVLQFNKLNSFTRMNSMRVVCVVRFLKGAWARMVFLRVYKICTTVSTWIVRKRKNTSWVSNIHYRGPWFVSKTYNICKSKLCQVLISTRKFCQVFVHLALNLWNGGSLATGFTPLFLIPVQSQQTEPWMLLGEGTAWVWSSLTLRIFDHYRERAEMFELIWQNKSRTKNWEFCLRSSE